MKERQTYRRKEEGPRETDIPFGQLRDGGQTHGEKEQHGGALGDAATEPWGLQHMHIFTHGHIQTPGQPKHGSSQTDKQENTYKHK